VGSGAFTSLRLSIPDRDPTPGETTPGELVAAAYSAFLVTNLAQRLERDDVPARELVVDVRCRVSRDVTARSLEGLDVEVRGRVPGLDPDAFGAAARKALVFTRQALGIRRGLRTELRTSLIPVGGN
jgi:organic hydroperoxide reductase OsmC/OhrA